MQSSRNAFVQIITTEWLSHILLSCWLGFSPVFQKHDS